MRQCYLENEIGQRKDLQNSIFTFFDPEGFGISDENEYEEMGNGFFKNIKTKSKQINIVGKMNFIGDDPYADYEDLLTWILGGYILNFIYDANGTEYWCEIDIEYFSKGEIVDECLECPASFLGKTPWFKAIPTTLNFDLDNAMGYKIYPYTYPYKYSQSGSSKSIYHTNAGNCPAEVKLIANGAMANPSLTLTNRSTGEILGKLKLDDLTIDAGEYLLYSSITNKSGVWLVSADGTKIKVSSYLDLTNNNFFTLPVGVPCMLTLDFTGSSTSSKIYIYEYFKGK